MGLRVATVLAGISVLVVSGCLTQSETEPPVDTLSVELELPAVSYTNATLVVDVTVQGDPTSVQLLLDGALLAELEEPYGFEWDTSAYSEGGYGLSVVASDAVSLVLTDSATVIVDRTAPTIQARSPGDGEANVWLDEPLVVDFDEPIVVGVDGVAIEDVGMILLATTSTLDETGTQLIITLDEAPSILPNTLTVSMGSVFDLSGNPFAASTWGFDTPRFATTQGPATQASASATGTSDVVLDAQSRPIVAVEENGDILVFRWDVGTSAWMQLGAALDFDGAEASREPAISRNADGDLFVAWVEGPTDSLYCSTYDDDTQTWISLGTINGGAGGASMAMTIGGAGFPIVSFVDAGDARVREFDGADWNDVGGVIDTATSATSVAFDGANPVIAYTRNDGISDNVHAAAYDGANWNALGVALDVNGLEAAVAPQLAMDGATPYVIWQESDVGAGYDKVFVRMFDGMDWQPIGTGELNVAATSATSPDLVTHATGPSAVWTEGALVYLAEFNGADWEIVTTLKAEPSSTASGGARLSASGDVVVSSWFESVGGGTDIFAGRTNDVTSPMSAD